MANRLATYLNDHLAGSVVAIEMLEHLEKTYRGTDLALALAGIHTDILADRQQLEQLMDRLHIKASTSRQAAAWITEKLTELKLRLDDMADGSLYLFEALEGIALGVDGKRALWHALAAAVAVNSRLGKMDYALLEKRAVEQRHRLESLRLDAALAALADRST